MRAVVCHEGKLSVDEIETPQPGPGQVLLKVRRTGICGSDLHARTHSDDTADVTAEVRDGQVFARTRHHDRMERSLAGIGLAPLDRARLDEGIDAVLAALPVFALGKAWLGF